jgi:hypothetical protein
MRHWGNENVKRARFPRRRLGGGGAVRIARRREGHEIAALKPIRNTCRPRKDVVEGQLADFHFAAQLDQLVRDPRGYPVYGDAEQFFELTYPTTGLKRLLERCLGRLSGPTEFPDP